MSELKFSWTRVNNDVNGNPRYVVHFLSLLTQAEKDTYSPNRYAIAVSRANCIFGRKFHNKQYGGGIVFQSYNLQETEAEILKVISEAEFAQQVKREIKGSF